MWCFVDYIFYLSEVTMRTTKRLSDKISGSFQLLKTGIDSIPAFF